MIQTAAIDAAERHVLFQRQRDGIVHQVGTGIGAKVRSAGSLIQRIALPRNKRNTILVHAKIQLAIVIFAICIQVAFKRKLGAGNRAIVLHDLLREAQANLLAGFVDPPAENLDTRGVINRLIVRRIIGSRILSILQQRQKADVTGKNGVGVDLAVDIVLPELVHRSIGGVDQIKSHLEKQALPVLNDFR